MADFRQLFPRPQWLKQHMEGPLGLISNWLLRAWNVIGQVEEWHVVGDTNEPAFQNSWTSNGSGYTAVAFYKDPFGRVHLKGLLASGTANQPAYTLPAGYRPDAIIQFNAGTSTTRRIKVDANGDVTPIDGNSYTDMISFRAEQ